MLAFVPSSSVNGAVVVWAVSNSCCHDAWSSNAFTSASTVSGLIASGRTVAMWSLDARDYELTEPAAIAASCAGVRAGDVILLHEGQQWTIDALPGIVQTIHAAGLECVTMHDLFAA